VRQFLQGSPARAALAGLFLLLGCESRGTAHLLVSATVPRAMPSERAIVRSLAPPSYLRRRISLTRRIDTLSAGIGSPAHRSPRRAKGRSSARQSSDGATLKGGRDQIEIGGRLRSGISGRLAPESALKAHAVKSAARLRRWPTAGLDCACARRHLELRWGEETAPPLVSRDPRARG
jgi:hypothetical protein